MTARLMALALLGCLLALHSGVAQDRKLGKDQPYRPGDTVPPQRHVIYPIRNADPATLASTLNRHFRGQAEISTVANGLLVSASPAAIDELTKLLDQLDRKPRSVQIELILADVTLKKGPDGKEVEVDLTGDAAAKLEALAKSGQAAVQRIRLIAVEGKAVTSTTGGNKPVVTSSAVMGGGGGFGGGKGGGGGGPVMQRSISYHAVGTTVQLTARVGTDNAVAVDLNVQESKVRPPEAGDEPPAAAAPSIENNTLGTVLSIPAGKAIVAQSIRSDTKSGSTLSLVLVTARVVDTGDGKSN